MARSEVSTAAKVQLARATSEFQSSPICLHLTTGGRTKIAGKLSRAAVSSVINITLQGTCGKIWNLSAVNESLTEARLE